MDGTQTDRVLYMITKEVVDRCDYLIDYHGGDLDESLRPYAYWGAVGKEAQDKTSKQMVLAFGLDHIIIWSERPTDPAATRYLDNTASVRGKPSIVVEAGHAGTVETDDVAVLVNGTLSTMRVLENDSWRAALHRESRLACKSCGCAFRWPGDLVSVRQARHLCSGGNEAWQNHRLLRQGHSRTACARFRRSRFT